MSKNFCADTKISQKCGSASHWWKPAKWLITAEVVVYDRSTCWLWPVNRPFMILPGWLFVVLI